MKKLILILLLMPLSILCQDDYPEWERVDLNMDSLSWYGTMEVNSRNELIMVMLNGIFKSTDFGENWIKFNAPDSIIYDYTFLKTNGPTIYTYGEVLDIYKKPTKYFVYSNDYGENWNVIPVDELTFPGYENSEFLFIDEKGDIWGISSNKKIDSSSQIIVNKFDILNKTTRKMFELPFSYKKILFQDSLTLLVDFKTYKNSNGQISQYKECCIYFTYNSGITWDSVIYNENTTPKYYDFDNKFGMGYDFFVSNNVLYIYPHSPTGMSLFKIELKTQKLDIEYFWHTYNFEIKRINDSTFYKLVYHGSLTTMPALYKSSDMSNWETILKEDEYTFRSLGFWIIDKLENHYFLYNYGLARTNKGDTTCRIINCKGLEIYWIDFFAVDSKSNIVILNQDSREFSSGSYENYIIYNPDTKEKQILTDIYMHVRKENGKDFFKCLADDSFIFRNIFGTGRFNKNFDDYFPLLLNDSTKIQMIYNLNNKGKNYLADTQSKNYILGKAYSEDYCKTWKLFEPINLPDSLKYGHFILNINSDLVLFGRSPNFNLSHDKGKTWVNIFNDSTNKLYNNKKYPDKYNYNESNGSGIVKYNSGGPIYYTLDHGYNWSEIDSNKQAFNFIHEIDQYTISDNLSNLPVSYDENYTFYVSTLHGIYRSTDTLKTFHNISKGIIEPSYIYDFQAGNDGRLYAVNYNGIWRTKKKILISVIEPKPDFSKSDIFICPNPADDIINVSLNLPHDLSILKYTLTNSIGMTVKTGIIQNPASFEISTKDLYSGAYFLVVETGSEIFCKTLLVQH